MRIRPVSALAGVLMMTVAFGAAGAQQDTKKLRRPTTTTVSSAGEVALSTYNAPAGDTLKLKVRFEKSGERQLDVPVASAFGRGSR